MYARQIITLTGLLASGLSIPLVLTHESYHDPQLDDQGSCASCHPGFAGGPNSPLHALHTKGPDKMTSNCSLCHTGNGRDNPLLTWSDNDGLGCMGCHGRDYGETIWNDYADLPTAGKTKASGYGLRRLHVSAGVLYCSSCHLPFPAQGTIFPESVSPPYYARDDVSLGDNPMAPCTNEDTLNDADGLGLDNDGDGLVDAEDPDCQPPEPDIQLTPFLLYWDFVLIGDAEAMVAQIENRGPTDLLVTQIDVCAGTSAELSWSPPPPFSVPPFGSHPLTVTYTPVDLGTDQGCLEIRSNDPDEPVALLDLSATGAAPPWPEIDLSPPSLDFGVVSIGGVATLDAVVTNLGQYELVVSVIDPCIGTSSEFDWAPPAPITVPPLSSRILSVTFEPTDEGVEQGCLEFLSNDLDEPAVTLHLSGTGGQAGLDVDLDIARFRVDQRARLGNQKPVTIELWVENMGEVDETRAATVTGVQNQVQIYQQTQLVSDPADNGSTSWEFPTYIPMVTGDIVWTVFVDDDDPDVDEATMVTEVRP